MTIYYSIDVIIPLGFTGRRTKKPGNGSNIVGLAFALPNRIIMGRLLYCVLSYVLKTHAMTVMHDHCCGFLA